MMGALLFGLIGSSALVLGGILGSYWKPPRWVTGVFLALRAERWSALFPSSSSQKP